MAQQPQSGQKQAKGSPKLKRVSRTRPHERLRYQSNLLARSSGKPTGSHPVPTPADAAKAHRILQDIMAGKKKVQPRKTGRRPRRR